MSVRNIIASVLGVLLAAPSAGALNTTVNSDGLQVLTLNLRSRLDQPDLREPAIARFLRDVRPDVVLLQEVGQVEGGLTQAHRLAKTAHYEVASCFNPRTRRGLAVLSRYPIVDIVVEYLPRKKRPALGVVLNVNGRLVSFVNVHLTPQLDAVKQRQLELGAALELMDNLPSPAFIGGDFNFGDSALENALLSKLVDTYRFVEPHAPGHTWDLRNPLARKNSYPKEPSRRLDRILLSAARARVAEASVVLDKPGHGGVYPSDHFGLYARIELFAAAERGGQAPQMRGIGEAGHHPALPAP